MIEKKLCNICNNCKGKAERIICEELPDGDMLPWKFCLNCINKYGAKNLVVFNIHRIIKI